MFLQHVRHTWIPWYRPPTWDVYGCLVLDTSLRFPSHGNHHRGCGWFVASSASWETGRCQAHPLRTQRVALDQNKMGGTWVPMWRWVVTVLPWSSKMTQAKSPINIINGWGNHRWWGFLEFCVLRILGFWTSFAVVSSDNHVTTWSPGICQVAVCSGGGTVYYMCTYTELLSG